MSKPPLRMKEMGGRTINENTKRRGGNTSHNLGDESMGKAQMNKKHLNVKPVDTIKIFFQVNIKNNALMMFSPD